MTLTLDIRHLSDEIIVGAIARHTRHIYRNRRRAVIQASKQPLVLLIRQAGRVQAFTPEGNTLRADEVRDLYPEQLDAFLQAVP